MPRRQICTCSKFLLGQASLSAALAQLQRESVKNCLAAALHGDSDVAMLDMAPRTVVLVYRGAGRLRASVKAGGTAYHQLLTFPVSRPIAPPVAIPNAAKPAKRVGVDDVWQLSAKPKDPEQIMSYLSPMEFEARAMLA